MKTVFVTGILVEDDDSCDKYRVNWRDKLLDHFLRGHGTRNGAV